MDQVMVTFFEEGKSYTGDASIEISCHGNPLITELICEDLLNRKCRLAEPGEFTRLAFLNGKIDLSQAEAVAQVISAKNRHALIASQKNLKGHLSKKLTKIQDTILQIQALVEAQIDFPEDDTGSSDRSHETELTNSILIELRGLLEEGTKTEFWNKKIRIALIGLPNAGKSSLFNAITGKARAIVHQEAGTTRDYLEMDLKVGLHWITLVDTAGLNNSENEVEKIGVGLSFEQIAEADLLLWVIDGSVPYPNDLLENLIPIVKNKITILVRNKIDLGTTGWRPELSDLKQQQISCLKGHGIDELIRKLNQELDDIYGKNQEDYIYLANRHEYLVKSCVKKMEEFVSGFNAGLDLELVATHLKTAREDIDQIIGSKTNEHILDKIFHQFCIGK